MDLLASSSAKMGELVAYACECAQAAAKLTTEIDGGEKDA